MKDDTSKEHEELSLVHVELSREMEERLMKCTCTDNILLSEVVEQALSNYVASKMNGGKIKE